MRISESKELGDVLTTEVMAAPDEIHQVEDRSLAIQIDADAESEVRHLRAQHGVTADKPYILLNP